MSQGFSDSRGLGGPTIVGKSTISQRRGSLTATGHRNLGDQNQHNPLGPSRKGSGLNPDKNPLGSTGQKKVKG